MPAGIPPPPRTPSPLLEDDTSFEDTPGLGIRNYTHAAPVIRTDLDYDVQRGISDSPFKVPSTPGAGAHEYAPSMLSPVRANFSVNGGLSPSGSQYSPGTPHTAGTDGGFQDLGGVGGTHPFNFTPQQYTAGRNAGEALGKRRGHKYRHSSIHASHMDSIFQPPTPRRTPLAVPASLPMPTRKEAWRSMTPNQTARLVWCLCHFAVSAFVQFSGSGSLAMTALSRLLLFDAAGATVCVAVDVMGNFEVWKRSSIKHPFGLERADVLAGFGMAVFIAFMGLDIISHGVQHSLENLGTHVAHSPHAHDRVGAGFVDITSILAITSTLISALLLKNHARIGRAMRFELIAGWGKVLGNPSHFLTLSCSLVLLVLPWLSKGTYQSFDLVLAFVAALLMIAFGVRLATSLASMLLMSYRPNRDQNAIRKIIDDVEHDQVVSCVEEARFWQVHYGLCMANFKLRYRNVAGMVCSDEATRLRQRLASLIRQRFGSASGVKWEVSLQLTAEQD